MTRFEHDAMLKAGWQRKGLTLYNMTVGSGSYITHRHWFHHPAGWSGYIRDKKWATQDDLIAACASANREALASP